MSYTEDRNPGSRQGDRPAASRSQLTARSRLGTLLAGGLFFAGAAITMIAFVAPHPPTLDQTGYMYLAAGQALFGAALVLAGRLRRVQGSLLQVSTILGAVAAVTIAIYLNGERVGGPAVLNEFFYVWPALYAGYFYKRPTIGAILGLIAVAYCAVSMTIGVSGGTLAVRGLITMSVVSGTAAFVHLLRVQVDSLVSRLDQLACTDSLTSLFNRRGFDESLDARLKASELSGETFSLLLGDIDHFKAVNDRFGHAAGDEVLAQIGQILAASTRSQDVASRIGGEEFAVLLPDRDRDQALATAARLRRDLRAIRDPGGAPITLSFGVSCSDGEGGQTAKSILAGADGALYEAKARGRDRAVASTSPLGHETLSVG